MILSPDDQHAIVSEANAAPSVHNTQPARWKFDGDDIWILAEPRRFLRVGDPQLNEAGLSCGAALEGTLIALAARGIGTASIEDHWSDEPSRDLKPAAKITLNGEAEPDPLSQHVSNRFTWRSEFRALPLGEIRQLEKWGERWTDIHLTTDTEHITYLADLNDALSLKYFSDRDYREEVAENMRLTKNHPMWQVDGLNAQSMQLSWFEAYTAKLALAYPVFEVLKRTGFGKRMTSEKSATLSSSGVALFHVPEDTSPVITGRVFYRLWLDLTALGLAVWPMSIIANDPETNAKVKRKFKLPAGDRLVNVLRIGGLPQGAGHAPARLPARELIVNA